MQVQTKGQPEYAGIAFGIIGKSKIPGDMPGILGIFEGILSMIGHKPSIMGGIWGIKHREFGRQNSMLRLALCRQCPPPGARQSQR